MNPQIRCVVLDIDDTLYLERDYAASGFRAVGEHLGSERFGPAAIAALKQGVRGTIFDVVLSDLGIEPGVGGIARLVSVYRQHRPEIELLGDARDCIERWAEATRLAVITDGPLESQKAKAQALSLATWCDPLIFTAELGAGRGKPHPAAFVAVEEQLGLEGSQCLYLADNPKKDFVTPDARGWTTVRIRRPGSLHEAVGSGSDVAWEFSSLRDLPAELTEMFL